MRTVVSEAKGRHVVAACAIQAGTTLFIEKPFAAAPVSPDRCELCLQTCVEGDDMSQVFKIVCEDCKVYCLTDLTALHPPLLPVLWYLTCLH